MSRLAIVLGLTAAPRMSHAGGPLLFSSDGAPVVWDAAHRVPYHTDLGGLGLDTHSQAFQLVDVVCTTWQNVSTARIGFQRAGDLPVDVDATNFGPYLGPFGGSTTPLGMNAIVFDADGSIFETLYGVGTGVVGFAAPTFVDVGGTAMVAGSPPLPPGARIIEGLAFLNGKFIDGIDDPATRNYELTALEMQAVTLHEFGHFAGLDHTQVHGLLPPPESDSFQRTEPIETMYSFIVNEGQATLERDDMASISALYPRPTFASTTGRITGRVLDSSGAPITGINVVARAVGHPEDAVSYVSGATLNPAGSYTLQGLTPGYSYTVEVQEIDVYARGGSSVGPFSAPITMPGPPEFYNGAGESENRILDDPSASTAIPIVAGATVSGIDIRLNQQSFEVNNAAIADINVQKMASGDFNEDGIVDVETTQFGVFGLPMNPTNATRLSLGLGNGNFSASTVIDAFPSGEWVVAGQLNAAVDQHLDVAVVSSTLCEVRVYLGDGHGGFGSPQTVPNAPDFSGFSCLKLGNLNGDPYPDLLVLQQDPPGGATTVYSLLNNGSGGFSTVTSSFAGGSGAPTSPFSVLADFAGGPTDDLIGMASAFNPVMGLLVNDGAGTFTLVPIPMTGITEYSPGHMAAADFNGDGDLDLAFVDPNPVGPLTNYSRSFLEILLGDGAGGFTFASRTTIPAIFAEVIATADFDLDGVPDVATGGPWYSSGLPGASLTIYFSNGAGGFRAWQTIWGLSELPTNDLLVTDSDGDGRKDLLVAKAPFANGTPTYPCSALLNRLAGPVAVGPATNGAARLWLAAIPNPAPGEPGVSFQLPVRGRAVLELFDVSGRRLRQSDEGELGPGIHTIRPLRGPSGRSLSPGVYLVRLMVGESAVTRRLVVTP